MLYMKIVLQREGFLDDFQYWSKIWGIIEEGEQGICYEQGYCIGVGIYGVGGKGVCKVIYNYNNKIFLFFVF